MRCDSHVLIVWLLGLSICACGAGELGTAQDDPSQVATPSARSSSSGDSTVSEVCPADHVDMGKIYPWPLDKKFELRNYNEYGQPLDPPELTFFSPWGDGKTYTLHHSWGTWCPRIDDVFRWEQGLTGGTNERLLYLDTYHFGDMTHTKIRNPGHVWATRCMKLNAPATYVDNDTEARYFTSSCQPDCCVGPDGNLIYKARYRVWKRLLGYFYEWSPYTDAYCSKSGCPGAYQEQGHWMVPVIRLDETTLPLNWWEKWWYWLHPALGRHVVVRTRGGKDSQFLWEGRLEAIK